eukprot:4219545-Pyramimonas_sp.AAC.1
MQSVETLRPMPRNTLLASRVPWISWVSMALLWKPWRPETHVRPGGAGLGFLRTVLCALASTVRGNIWEGPGV